MFLRLENLAHEANEGSIREFFFGFQISINCVRLYYVGRNKEASVWFETEKDLLSALKLDGKSLFDKHLKLLLSTEDPSDPTSQKPAPLVGRANEWDNDSGGSSYAIRERSRDKYNRERSKDREWYALDVSEKRPTSTEQGRESEIWKHSRTDEYEGERPGARTRSPIRKTSDLERYDDERYAKSTDQEMYSRAGDRERYDASTDREVYSRADQDRYDTSRDREMFDSSRDGGQRTHREMFDSSRDGGQRTHREMFDSSRDGGQRHSPSRGMQMNRESFERMPLRNVEMEFTPNMQSSAVERRPLDPFRRPRSRSPIRRSLSPIRRPFSPDLRSEPVCIPPPISPTRYAPRAQKIVSLLDISVKPVPMKQQPFMSLFPNFLNGKRFYLEISELPPNVTASEVWSWVDGSKGKSEGVILGLVPPNHDLCMSSRAFIVCETMRDLHNMQRKISVPSVCTAVCTPGNVNLFLQNLDVKCEIWVTNPSAGKDTALTLEERVQIYFKKSTLPLEDEPVMPTRMAVRDPFSPKRMSATSDSFGVSTSEVLMFPENAASLPKKTKKPALIDEESFMLLFPSFISERRFYLEIAEISSRVTPSDVWAWADGVRGKSEGVILAKVPPNHSLFTSSRAFIVFKNMSDLLEMQQLMPGPLEQTSPCSPEDVNLYLQQLDNKCQIWVTNPGEKKDSRLTAKEREEVLMKAEPGLLGDAPLLLGEVPNMSVPKPAPHSQGSLQKKKIKSLFDISVEPVAMKIQPFMSLFPAFLNGQRFYLEASELLPDTTASEVWSWVMGSQGKSEGVILGRVPVNHPLGNSRAFIVYEKKSHLSKDKSLIPARTMKCSPTVVNQFLKLLDMECQVYVTNPAIGKDTMLTIQERLDICMNAK